MDAAMRRSDIRCLTIRPSWVQWEGNYDRNLGPVLRDPEAAPSAGLWAYIDVYDLADALRARRRVRPRHGHEVFYIASPDNGANRPLADLVRHHHGDAIELARALARPDAAGISIAKAERLLGYAPTRSWRDYLTEDGDAARRRARAPRARGHRRSARARGGLSVARRRRPARPWRAGTACGSTCAAA